MYVEHFLLFDRFAAYLQKYPEHAVYKVLQLMIRREEVQHRMQRKMLYRVKWATAVCHSTNFNISAIVA